MARQFQDQLAVITNQDSSEIRKSGWRSFMGIAAVFFILLSSCGVKASVKEFLGVQRGTAKTEDFRKNNQTFLITHGADCVQQQAEELIVHTSEVKFSAPALAVLLTSAIHVLFLFDPVSTAPPHPLYGDTSRISFPTPIFIQHESLLI
tara:strand:+ start:2149 stop:2595 length:447 start_codon:yes stop_codon:yes gene_type:complete